MNNNSNISPGPWEYVPGTEHHGPYVTTVFGSTICDFYTMTEPREWSTAAGGPSKPVNFCGEDAEANARLAGASFDLLEALKVFVENYVDMVNSGDCGFWNPEEETMIIAARAAIAKALGTPQDAPKP